MIPLDYIKQIESLQDLISGGIIEQSEGQLKIFMLKEKAVLEVHKRDICQRSDGRFITKVDVNGTLSQKTAYTYKGLIDKLYDFYFGIQNTTLENFYPVWVDYRRNESSVKEKTIKENGYIWNSLLKDTAITKKPMRSLDVDDYISYFRSVTKGRKLTRKRFNDMKSVLNGMLFLAVEKKIIKHNPINDINFGQFSYKPENNQIFPYTSAERALIIDYLGDDLYSLAIKFYFCLTVRIGELKALRYDDIRGNFIHVCRFVNYQNQVEDDIKGHTADGIRWLPLTDEAREIIDLLRQMNLDNNYLFFVDGKPITTVTFNRHLKKCCNALGIEYRSSHKLRFSTASILYQNGLSTPELQKMLGHSTLAMTEHYLRNIASSDKTYEKVNAILT